MQLIIAEAACGDFSDVSEHFDHFGRTGAGLLAMEILTYFQDHQSVIEDRLKMAQTGVQLLQHQRENPRADLSWAPAIRNALSNPQYSSGRSMPSLYALNVSSSDRDSELSVKRRDLHDRFCHEMLAVDELAEDGFSGLLASHEAASEVDGSFVELARDVVLRAAKKRLSGNSQFQNYVVHYSNNPREAPLRAPGEFLVRHAWETDDWSVVRRTRCSPP